jgi:hypothetical protein
VLQSDLQTPHVHLISNYRYAFLPNVPAEVIVDYLLKAPSIARNVPFTWTFLDGVPDGTLYLVWQPLNHLGTAAASDGYVWADPEGAFSLEMKGYVSY